MTKSNARSIAIAALSWMLAACSSETSGSGGGSSGSGGGGGAGSSGSEGTGGTAELSSTASSASTGAGCTELAPQGGAICGAYQSCFSAPTCTTDLGVERCAVADCTDEHDAWTGCLATYSDQIRTQCTFELSNCADERAAYDACAG